MIIQSLVLLQVWVTLVKMPCEIEGEFIFCKPNTVVSSI